MASAKKGFVYSAASAAPFRALNVKWYYTWGRESVPGLDVPFVPMVWGAPDAALLDATQVALAFNEPDGNSPGAQSNISIQGVVSMWPTLRAKAGRLGSVAAAQNPLANAYTPHDGSAALQTSYFDALWQHLDPKPDFIALHWYAPPNVHGFLSWIDAVWAKYQKPIWITEFAVADWSGKFSGGFESSLVQEFMREACAGLDARAYVEKYSWKTRATTDPHMGTSALFEADGSLTPLGQIYSTL